jgi:hypothetical protein
LNKQTKLLIQYGHLKKNHTPDDFQKALVNFRSFMEPYSNLDTDSLFEVPRCGMPDNEIKTGSGSWKVGCHVAGKHSALYRVDKRRMPSFLVSTFEPAWELMRQAYEEIGLSIIRDDNTEKYNSLVTFEKGRGWIGLAIVGRGHTCNTRIWAKFDTVYKPNDLLNQWARLLAHELGHNCGLSHSRGGIMNPSILPGKFDRTAWLNDPSYEILKRWFGIKPTTPPIWTIPNATTSLDNPSRSYR